MTDRDHVDDGQHDEGQHEGRRPEGIDDGIDHLQHAASEMIAAGRAFLDAVEEVVRDRDAVASVVDAFGSIASAATQAASRVATGRDRMPGSTPGWSSRPSGDDDGDADSGVQHITVS